MMQNNLNRLMTTVFQSATGAEALQTASTAATKALFDRLSAAAQAGDTHLFEQLVEAEKQQARQKEEPTLLIAATMAGRAEIVRSLIAAGADVNARVEQFFAVDALELAVEQQHIEIVKMLLAAGADPNWNNQNPGLCPIRTAVRHGNAEMVRILINAGAAVKFGTGFRLLVDAAEKSTADVVQVLVAAGCNVNTKALGGDTPLTAACKRADVEIVQTLIAAGANVNKTGMHEFTPLISVFYAPKLSELLLGHGLIQQQSQLSNQILAIVQALVQAGANLQTHDLQGKTPLMLTIAQNLLESASYLISAGVDVNERSQPDPQVISLFRGNGVSTTALHLAVEVGHLQAVELLLAAGVDPTLADSQGNTPLSIATTKGLTEIAALLDKCDRYSRSSA